MKDNLIWYFVLAAICFLLLLLVPTVSSNETRINDLENKVNGKCIYVNYEYYCKE